MSERIKICLSACDLIRRTANSTERALSSALRPHGLTLAQYEILSLLEGMRCGCCGEAECRCESSNICQNDVGERVATTKGNVSGIVQRLVEDGLVSREPNPRNRRENAIRITAKGRASLFAAEPDYCQGVAQTLSSLECEEIGELCTFLNRLGIARSAPDAGG